MICLREINVLYVGLMINESWVEYRISFCYLFVPEVGKGQLWKCFAQHFDLFALIVGGGNMIGMKGTYMALIPLVLKIGWIN